MVDNQHRNDRAMVEYERIEHVVLHKDGENSELYPTVPNECFPPAREPCGFAQRKSSPPVSAEVHRHQLQYAVTALDLSSIPTIV